MKMTSLNGDPIGSSEQVAKSRLRVVVLTVRYVCFISTGLSLFIGDPVRRATGGLDGLAESPGPCRLRIDDQKCQLRQHFCHTGGWHLVVPVIVPVQGQSDNFVLKAAGVAGKLVLRGHERRLTMAIEQAPHHSHSQGGLPE
jgi:hypothetical protein